MLFSFPDSVYVDESLVSLIFAPSHLLGKEVELFKLAHIKLVVRWRCSEVRWLVNHDMTHLVDKQTLLRGQKSEHRRYLQSEPVNKLLEIKFFINLNAWFS